MLGVMVLVIVTLTALSLTFGNAHDNMFDMEIPLCFFAFLVYKFGKKGLLSTLVFVGSVNLLYDFIYGWLFYTGDGYHT